MDCAAGIGAGARRATGPGQAGDPGDLGPRVALRVPPSATPRQALAPDCRHYHGDHPCLHNRLCAGCPHYDPNTCRLCIIKLGALGDVVRTLCILPSLRRRYPRGQITWVSRPEGCRLLEGHPLIDRLLPFEPLNTLVLAHESFDLVINLDKEPAPCALAMSLAAPTRLGIALSPQGTPVPANPEAEPYFHLGVSDQLKFRVNRRPYPQLVCEALGLGYHGDRYELPRRPEIAGPVRARLEGAGWRADEPTVGINVGAAATFANKMWRPDRIADCIVGLRVEQPHAQILLLGGLRERRIVDQVFGALPAHGFEAVFDAGTDHDEPHFAAVVDACDVVFAGDTMALHVAIALGKWVVAFFGPTCEQEIELYGRGEKLVAAVPCAPCYKQVCDHADRCVLAIPAQEAVRAIAQGLALTRRHRLSLPLAPSKAG